MNINKLHALIIVAFTSFVSAQSIAAPVDDGPPAQTQKDSVPQTTDSGNYLEPQATENTDAADGDSKHNKKTKHKGKNVTEQPKEGVVDVTPR